MEYQVVSLQMVKYVVTYVKHVVTLILLLSGNFFGKSFWLNLVAVCRDDCIVNYGPSLFYGHT